MANFETSVSLIMECRPLSTAHSACTPLANLTVCPFFYGRGMPTDAPHLKPLLSRTSTLLLLNSCREFIIFSCRHTSIIDVAPGSTFILLQITPQRWPLGGCNTRPHNVWETVLLPSNKLNDLLKPIDRLSQLSPVCDSSFI